uniref:Uncharacterized protein n=1 Tax=Arundo donax TaxID=35708 RepID=A0A0A9H7N0_ARUDO
MCVFQLCFVSTTLCFIWGKHLSPSMIEGHVIMVLLHMLETWNVFPL